MASTPNTTKASKINPARKMNEQNDAVYGIYLAEVIATKDVSRTGRIRVFIPAISKDKNTSSGYFDAVWTSPFAGSTDPRQAGTDIESPQQTTSSYGLWAVPPDLGNLVLVAFGDGNTKYPLVISCLYQDRFNYMVPGNPGGKTYQAPGANMPTMEKNKRTADINHNDTFRPIQHTLAESITKQGLANDPLRGAGNSSARRESPSEVFGLLTPGPRDPDNFDYRLGGHSIVLDDNLSSRNIRIRTANGNQLLLDDTKGVIYLINKDGNAWMEMNQAGDVMLYAEGSISMRAKQDFNIRADYNVNIEAGQDVNIKAAGDNIAGDYAGEGAGSGGFVAIESKKDTAILAQTNFYATAIDGDTNLNSAGDINITSGKSISEKAEERISKKSGKNFSIKSGDNFIAQASGDIVEKAGRKILMNSDGPDADEPTIAETPEPIVTSNLQDAAENSAEYDRTADAPLTTSGHRTGSAPQISTIVSKMMTAEPYEGHAIPNPANDNTANMKPDETLRSSLPTNSNGLTNSSGTQIPSPVNSPSGLLNGLGFSSSGLPDYSLPQNVANNFSPANQKQLFSAAGLAAVTGAITSTVPTIRFPKLLAGAKSTYVAGLGQKLNEFSARAKSVGISINGTVQDMQSPSIKVIKDKINAAAQASRTTEELATNLQKAGVSLTKDGTTNVYQDVGGTRIIDFANGLSDNSAQTILLADLNTTSNSIKNAIKVPISDNQLAALTSFANHIGTANFSKSKVLSKLNNGEYGAVPNAMMEFISRNGVIQDDYVQRRQFEGELFSTPDGVPLPPSSPNYAQTARNIRTAREDYLASGGTV